MKTLAIRGAVTAKSNTIEDIENATLTLFNEIMLKNSLSKNDISHIIFSITNDLTAVYPAKCLREKLSLNDVPLMCLQEANIDNALEKCIRVLVVINSDKDKCDIKHIYLEGAKVLRPDLIN